jgi:hypothetical protein
VLGSAFTAVHADDLRGRSAESLGGRLAGGAWLRWQLLSHGGTVAWCGGRETVVQGGVVEWNAWLCAGGGIGGVSG